MKKSANFPDGAALVLGASGGIGSKCAAVLAEDGSDLALGYFSNREPIDAVASEAEAMGRTASAHQLDVRDSASLDQAVSAAIAEHGRIHTLVWAAGPLVEQLHLAETPFEMWKNAIDTEVHGLFKAVQALLPHMREAGGGSIVHLGSAGHMRWPDKDGLSVAPKACNESFLRGIAREEGRHGIRANSVLVGVINAGMFKELTEKGEFQQDWIDAVQASLSVKRWGEPEEIGYAVSYLASNRAAYVTAQQINVSGGYGI